MISCLRCLKIVMSRRSVGDIDEIGLAMNLSGECNLLGSVSSQQKFEARDVKALCLSQLSGRPCYIALRQISVTALFYLDNSRRIHSRSMRACQPKDVKRREWRSMPAHGRESARALAPLFICFFLPLGLPCANWA